MSTDPPRLDGRLAADLIAAYFSAGTQPAIDAAEAAIRARSSGRVTAGQTVFPARSREDRWLGPLRRAPGGLRSAMLFGESEEDRRERLAHIDLSEPTAHPGGGGTTRCAPVLPLAQRPLVEVDRVIGESPCDGLYRRLLRADHLVHLTADRPDLPELRGEVRGQVADTLASIDAGRAACSWSPWEGEPAPRGPIPRTPPQQRPPYDPSAISVFRVFDDGTGLIGFARAAVVFRLRDGKVLRVLDTRGAEILCAPSPRLLLLLAWVPSGRPHEHLLDQEGQDQHVFAMDGRSGRWTARPDEPPPVQFVEVYEAATLRDHRERSIRLAVGDYPVLNVATPDHRFIWVEDKHGDGGVFRLRDGGLVTWFNAVEAMPDVPQLDREGVLKRARPGSRLPAKQAAVAILRSQNDRWLTFRDGVVAEDGRPLLALGGGSRIATFAPDGRALWTSDGREVRCVELAPKVRVRAGWPLAPLRVAAGAPAR